MIQSREKFAESAAEYLRGQGETRPIAIDATHERLVVGEPPGQLSFISLAGAYAEHVASPEADAVRVFQKRFWATIQRASVTKKEDLLRSVLPRIRDRAWFAAVRRQAILELGAPSSEALEELVLPHQVLNDDLGVHLAIELSTSVVELNSDRLKAWEMTLDETMTRAKANLLARSPKPFEEHLPGLYVSPWHDGFDASRMVLPELFAPLKVKGLPVVLAPTHDTLLVAGSDDTEALKQLVELAEQGFSSQSAHSGVAFRLEGGTWLPWLPSREHPTWEAFKLLSLQTTAAIHARQQQLLEVLLEANGYAATVPQIRAFRTATGDILTAAAWVDGVSSLLPKTDRIDFVRLGSDDRKEVQAAWSAPFAKAQQILGDMMQPIGDVPERWLVQSFPSEEQLKLLESEGKPSEQST
jgi:hypothetical protein